MVSIRSLLFLFLTCTVIHSKPYLFELGLHSSHSPQEEQFYRSIMEELRYQLITLGNGNYYSSESSQKNNLNSTPKLFFNISFHQIALRKWRLTPIANFAFSHKELVFSTEGSGFIFSEGYQTKQLCTSIYAGLSPEFLRYRAPQKGDENTYFYALRPLGRFTQRFFKGDLDKVRFTTGQMGLEAQIGLLNSDSPHLRSHGIALTFHALYERFLLGERGLKTTYGYILHRQIEYPKHSFHVGASLSFILRRLKKEEQL